jgi:hypothetical protein
MREPTWKGCKVVKVFRQQHNLAGMEGGGVEFIEKERFDEL